jgi:hypothetical protein
MGSAASTQGPLQRARKIVIIRAYNARPATETLSEQFEKLSRVSHTGKRVLNINDVKAAIGLSQSWFDDLLNRIAGNEIGEVEFDSFITFLHDGSMPQIATVAEPKNPTPRGPKGSLSSSFHNDFVMPPIEPPILMGFSPLQPSGLASSPVHMISDSDFEPTSQKLDYKVTEVDEDGGYKCEGGSYSAIPRRLIRDNRASRDDAVYPDVWTCLKFEEPTKCRDILSHNGTTLSLNRKDSHRKVGPSRPLWRKRETIIHERIVQYTTVDADGTTQELVESEKSQNEIVHLECKETGEFAHRESSKFESTETFNNEVVAHDAGNEEYLHMKSRDDEYEHLESNMPTKMQERAAQEAAAAAAQAQAEAEAQARAAAGEGLEPDMPMGPGSLHLDPGVLPMGADGLPMTQEQFDEDAQRWWEAQQQQQQHQQMYEQQQQQMEGGGGQPGQPHYHQDGPSPFDDDAQQWWNAQQQQKHHHQQQQSPVPSHLDDEDAQQWWNEQHHKQQQQYLYEQQQNHQPQHHSQCSSPLPMKFPNSEEAHHGSPNNHGLPSNNDMEKENDGQRWSKQNPNIYHNNKQFPHKVEQPET